MNKRPQISQKSRRVWVLVNEFYPRIETVAVFKCESVPSVDRVEPWEEAGFNALRFVMSDEKPRFHEDSVDEA